MIEDNPDSKARLRDILQEDGYNVESAASFRETFQRDDLAAFSIILVDRRLPDGAADQYLPRLKQTAPDAAIIVMTDYADIDGVIEVIRHGAVDYIVKPIHPERLKIRLKRIFKLREAEERILQQQRLVVIGEMLAVVSHESRNDLQCINACLELLAFELGNQPRALDLVHRIEKAQDRLRLLFEDLCGYASPLVIHRELHNVNDILLDAWESLLPQRKKRQVRLDGGNDEPIYCTVDRLRLEQVFRNILENALMACADPVAITWHLYETELQDGKGVRITLADNGPGLPGELVARIFDPFVTTKSNGTGLGMAICKRIVEAHGGRIAAESRPGQGARFVITLPRFEPPRMSTSRFQAAKTPTKTGACRGYATGRHHPGSPK